MKKIIFSFIATILFFLVFLISHPLVYGVENIQSNEHVILEKDKVIKSDYFAAGDSVTLDGTVSGDAYLAGGKVTVNGTVKGDLLVAGGDLNLRGKIEGNIRALGGQIIITSLVGKNVAVAGGTVNLADTSKIGGNLVAGAGNLNVYSEITEDLTAGAGQLTIGNKIGRDVNTGVGSLTIASSAQILGTTNYWSNEDARIESGAQLSGQVNKFKPREFPAKKAGQNAEKFFTAAFAAFKVISILSALVIGALLIWLIPTTVQNIAKNTLEKPLQSLGWGFLLLAVAPVLFIVLLVTVIGIPMAFIVLAVYLLAIYFSKIFISIAIGIKIFGYFNKNYNLYWALIVGLIAYLVLTSIPILGGLLSLLAVFAGLGSLAMVKLSLYKSLKGKSLV